MNFGELLGMCGIILVFTMFFALIIIVAYNGANTEYKYTANVPCYDLYGSLIENTTCQHEVYCGPWQESTPFRKGRLLCEETIRTNGVIKLNDVVHAKSEGDKK